MTPPPSGPCFCQDFRTQEDRQTPALWGTWPPPCPKAPGKAKLSRPGRPSPVPCPHVTQTTGSSSSSGGRASCRPRARGDPLGEQQSPAQGPAWTHARDPGRVCGTALFESAARAPGSRWPPTQPLGGWARRAVSGQPPPGPWWVQHSLETKSNTGGLDSPSEASAPQGPSPAHRGASGRQGPRAPRCLLPHRGEGCSGRPLTGKTLCAQVTGEERGRGEDGRPSPTSTLAPHTTCPIHPASLMLGREQVTP